MVQQQTTEESEKRRRGGNHQTNLKHISGARVDNGKDGDNVAERERMRMG